MHVMMASQLKSLLLIASQLSGYPVPADATPEVMVVNQVEMAKDECNGGDALSVLTCPILGFYEWPIAAGADKRPERIWVREDAEESENSITVHELTHWLQWHNGFHPTMCPERFLIEYQAYFAAFKYRIVYEGAEISDGFAVSPTFCPTQPEEKTK